MNRYSVNAVYSMAAEQDVEVEDELARSECWRERLCGLGLGFIWDGGGVRRVCGGLLG